MTIIEKPWGHEEIWATSEKYVGKILYIKKGHRLSLQYHVIKEETIRVLKGTLYLHHRPVQNYILGDASMQIDVLKVGESFHIVPEAIHRFEAKDGDVTLVEVSTPELDDVVRLSDDYNRENEN